MHGYITNRKSRTIKKEKTTTMKKDTGDITDYELKVVKRAIKDALSLRAVMVRPEMMNAYRHDPKVVRKQKRFIDKEIPALKAALAKLS
jgi:hypothetical protein